LNRFRDILAGSDGLISSQVKYMNNILIIVEVFVENLWSIMKILCCFELSCGLPMNFSKIIVVGVSVKSFLQVGAILKL